MRLILFFVCSLAAINLFADAKDIYCAQAAQDGSVTPTFQLQISEETFADRREFYVATKYASALSPADQFSGAQTFTQSRLQQSPNEDLVVGQNAEKYFSSEISNRYNEALTPTNSFQIYKLSPAGRFYEIQLNTEGENIKASVLRITKLNDHLDIAVAGLTRAGTDFVSLLKEQEEARKTDMTISLVRTDLSIRKKQIVCREVNRNPNTAPRPRLIK